MFNFEAHIWQDTWFATMLYQSIVGIFLRQRNLIIMLEIEIVNAAHYGMGAMLFQRERQSSNQRRLSNTLYAIQADNEWWPRQVRMTLLMAAKVVKYKWNAYRRLIVLESRRHFFFSVGGVQSWGRGKEWW